MTDKYFVFIITSRDNPIYEQFDSIRRKQMKEQGVRYKFLLNGSLPQGYSLQDDEVLSPDASFNPGMYMKFIRGCEELLVKDSGLPDVIIRLNSSTFVDFRKIPVLLEALPKTKYLGGYPLEYVGDADHYFIQGTAMIFSWDCIEYLIANQSDTRISTMNDDVVLSEITNDYTKYFMNLYEFFTFYWYNTMDYERIQQNSIFFRIKNPDRETYDVRIWIDLYNMLR